MQLHTAGPCACTAHATAEGYAGVVMTTAIFIDGVARAENFSAPAPTSPFCPPDLCWQNATATKYWGMVSAIWPWRQMLADNGALSALQ